jgi:hypothetical protein
MMQGTNFPPVLQQHGVKKNVHFSMHLIFSIIKTHKSIIKLAEKSSIHCLSADTAGTGICKIQKKNGRQKMFPQIKETHIQRNQKCILCK